MLGKGIQSGGPESSKLALSGRPVQDRFDSHAAPETLTALLPASYLRHEHQSRDEIATFRPRLGIQSGRFAGPLPPRGLV